MPGSHKNIPVGAECAHPPGYVQTGDPGAVGAYRPWADVTDAGSGFFAFKIRNAGDSAWLTLPYAPLASPALTGTPTIDGAAVATEDYVDAAVSGLSGAMAVTTESTTGRTLALTDANDYIRCTNASATAVTVPPNSDVAFPVGTTVHIEQAGAGTVTITPGSGVTVNVHGDFTLVTDGTYAVASITKVATDKWTAYGKLVAA